MRRVQVYELKRGHPTGNDTMVESGIAWFHQFGSNHLEYESGEIRKNITIAIIEWANGKVSSVDIELIKFIDNREEITDSTSPEPQNYRS